MIEQKNKIKRLKSYARKIKAKIQSTISLYLNSSYHLGIVHLSLLLLKIGLKKKQDFSYYDTFYLALYMQQRLSKVRPWVNPAACFVNKVFFEHRHVHFIYIFSMAAFMLQEEIWVAITEVVRSKIFIIWPLYKKLANL